MYLRIMTAQLIEPDLRIKLKLLENSKFSRISRLLASGLIKFRCINKTWKAFVKTFVENTNTAEQNLVRNHCANR